MLQELFVHASTVRRMREGPLGPYVDGFGGFLRERGHPRSARRSRIRLVADFSRWLKRHGCEAGDITPATVDRFLRARWQRLRRYPRERPNLELFRQHLRALGVLPAEALPKIEPAGPPIAREFARYLEKDRALTQATLVNYVPFARLFLSHQSAVGRKVPAEFRPDDIARFVLRHARRLSPGRAKLMVTALRSFFRFLRLRDEITSDLAACVPTVPNWRLTELPKCLPQEHVEHVLKSFNPEAPAGRRDHAILLLLARLGLRATEIVHLELEDLDWEAGEIVVRGKGARHNRLPLPGQVGRALAAYLRHGRPQRCPTRRVFVQAYAPFMGFAGSMTVSSLVRRALFRAGLHPARTGAHLFRHAVASQMLRRGATLVEIGEVLRHRHPDTTAVYAKVDVARLRALAQPWPGGRP